MKLLFADDFRLCVLRGDDVVDVSEAVQDIPHLGPNDLMAGLIANFDRYRERIGEAAKSGKAAPLSSVRVRPPLPKPGNIVCMAVNYMEDGTRTAPAPINAFHKSPNAVIGHGDTMVLPDVAGDDLRGRGGDGDHHRQARHATSAPPMRWTTSSATPTSSTARRAGSCRRATLLPDEVARDLRADRPVHRHRRRDRRSAEAADQAVGQRRAEAELQHRRHGAQDRPLHRVGDARSIRWSPATSWRPAPTTAGCRAFRTATRSRWRCDGLGRLTINVRDDLKRTWSRETRLERKEKGQDPLPPQLTGKYAAAAVS